MALFTNKPWQLGQILFHTSSTHSEQKVRSNEQIVASSLSDGNAL